MGEAIRLNTAARLVGHATLGLACLCLVQTEEPFLPGLRFAALPVLALIALACWAGGRWVLPVWGANVLGMAIAAGGGVWLFGLHGEDSWVHQVPLHTALVPHLGPLLTALLLVKLFRPQGRNDFWFAQGVGLLQVILACVLASDEVFALLLLAYLGAALLALALHHLAAEQAASRPAAGAGPLRFRWRLIPLTLGSSAAVAATSLVLFLLTPRLNGPSWEPFHHFGSPQGGAQTGVNPDAVDLNEVGRVEANDEVAFTLTAEDDAGQPRDDLPTGLRLRGSVFDRYEAGVLTTLRVSRRRAVPQRRLPDFGAGQTVLTFRVRPGRAGGLFLAEPVRFGPPPDRLPVVAVPPRPSSLPPLFAAASGTALPSAFLFRSVYRYRQVLPANADPDRSPAEFLEPDYPARLLRQPVPDLATWTAALLRRLAHQSRYGLGPADAAPAYPLPPARRERTARALADFLAHSGEYTYTLDLRRQEPDLDPVVDFLLHVKQGHCQRFATALMLMLRSQGVPARVVVGYRGVESEGEGRYVVRQRDAHSWVEVLVPRPGAEADLDWLALDPTPGDESPGLAGSLVRWWQARRLDGRTLWRGMVLDYGADNQADLWDGLMPGKQVWVALAWLASLLLAAAVALAWAVRRLRRRGRARVGPTAGVGFHARLLDLLARHAGLRPGPAQTPREFAVEAGRVLAAHPATAAWTGLPAVAADLFYRVRFGNHPLEAAEARDLDSHLDRLAEALAASR